YAKDEDCFQDDDRLQQRKVAVDHGFVREAADSGQANTVSVTIAPVMRLPTNTPQSVSTGMSALRRQCFQITTFSLSPLMRANLTYSVLSTSRMLDRVRRMKPAVRNAPRVSTGST